MITLKLATIKIMFIREITEREKNNLIIRLIKEAVEKANLRELDLLCQEYYSMSLQEWADSLR